MSEDVDANRQVALDFLQLAFGMQMDSAISMLAEDVTWWVIGDPAKIKVAGLKNRDKTIRMMSSMHKALPQGMRHTIIATTAEADRVAVEVEAEGPWHDGRLYRNRYHYLLRVNDGKVTSIREYMDPMQIPV